MQLGMVGLGRMGANLVRRLMADGHHCVVFDVDAKPIRELVEEGATGADELERLVAELSPPRVVWLMIPAGHVQDTVDRLAESLTSGDTIIDGGNSYYRDDIARSEQLQPKGIHYVDCGTSGGVRGIERGYCLMIGGESSTVARLSPVWKSIAPGAGSADPTPGRDRPEGTAHEGYLHCGPSGAGHFVKMVHNGVEYGMMGAIAEGLSIIRHADAGKRSQEIDAETTPLRYPEYFQYELDVAEVAEAWRRGSVISSWLIDLTAEAFARSPDLAEFAGRVSDSGEGRWTAQAAIDEGVPAPVIQAALNARFQSRDRGEFAGKVQSAMRSEFGGHQEKPQR
ncbi:MAG: phosphogluconate dehydrogenase (NAD(+)-dependent, decarboxylating) [Acidimicrobiia bacterium]